SRCTSAASASLRRRRRRRRRRRGPPWPPGASADHLTQSALVRHAARRVIASSVFPHFSPRISERHFSSCALSTPPGQSAALSSLRYLSRSASMHAFRDGYVLPLPMFLHVSSRSQRASAMLWAALSPPAALVVVAVAGSRSAPFPHASASAAAVMQKS